MCAVSLMLVAALILIGGVPARASLPRATEDVVARYLRELDRVEHTNGRTSIERLFALADTLSDCLLLGGSLGKPEILGEDIEGLSETEYAELRERLRGMVLHREEVVIVAPDSALFLPLARNKGLEGDRDFMEIYFQTQPHAWPAYVRQQTDYSGCTDYGTGKLVTLYRGWLEFRSKHPRNYSWAVTRDLEEIQEEFGHNGCACGGKESVIREFDLFLKSFPKDSITPRVREELDAIRNNQSRIRFNCISG